MTADPLAALLQRAHRELDTLAPVIDAARRLGKPVRVTIYVRRGGKIESKVEA